VFYGVALVSASKYTLHDTFSLGIAEIILGIISLFLAKYNLICWALGFGVLHIIYGTVMYFKYDIAPKKSK
jgi:putative exporter of polyketide antibiotics